QNDYPKAVKVYDIKLDGAKYYGPFRSSVTVNTLLETINRDNYLRSCREVKLNVSKSRVPCLYHQIGQCFAPCNYTQSFTDYRSMVNNAIEFIESQTTDSALSTMEQTMNALADELMFEEAAYVRDKIDDLKRVLTNLKLTSKDFKTQDFVVKCFGENMSQPHPIPSPPGEGRFNEVFFISCGKLIKNIILEKNSFDNKLIEEAVSNIYFNGNLFGKSLYNIPAKVTPEDLDAMKIVYNWIYHNNSPQTLLKIEKNTKAKEILEFVIG
ncbi:MAG TPA: UvrB/UvrC motif-containing protein, partial [Ignavibacteria bacterium]